MAAEQPERAEILEALEALERRFRDEQERHSAVLAEMRDELHQVVRRGDERGVSITSMAKAMKVSRGRLNRMLEALD